ncbi:MAG: hypothetical protein EXR66_07905 [Dehalococcoidia bacterium]|nr:hypothetical protein [Dehalococcoidia bacterium]
MVYYMITKKMKKTTLNIDEAVMRRLKEEAARRGETMSSLVETAIWRLLDAPKERPELPPLPSWDMGGSLVDVSDRRAVYEVLDRERDERLYGHLTDMEPTDGAH